MKDHCSSAMEKTAKRLFSILLILCVLFCPYQSLKINADAEVTYASQPTDVTYDSETDWVHLSWRMNVPNGLRVWSSTLYVVTEKGEYPYKSLDNSFSANSFDYDFPVVAPNQYTCYIRTVWSLNYADPGITYDAISEKFTITYVDNRFTVQPESAPYNASTGKLDINWSTNFTPTKVKVYEGYDLIDTLTSVGMNGSYSFNAKQNCSYSLSAYWDDVHYKKSQSFGVTTPALEFIEQPQDMPFYMTSSGARVSWKTNFNPYKIEVIRNTPDKKVMYSALYSRSTGDLSCAFMPAIGSKYFVRAYMNEDVYVESELFEAYYPNGFSFIKEPQDGTYKASTLDFETNFQLSFTPALLHVLYYDIDDEEYKYTNEYDLYNYADNNYTIVIPYRFRNTQMKIVAEYYGEDSDGEAKVYSVSSREFIAREVTGNFTQQPSSDHNQPLVYPGIDYKLSWQTDFKPVKIKIVRDYRNVNGEYDWETEKTITSGLSMDMTYTDFLPEVGVGYTILAYYTDDDYVASDIFVEEFSDLRFTLDPYGSYTIPDHNKEMEYTYIWNESFIPYKVVLAYNYENRHEWDTLWEYSNVYQYNEVHFSDSRCMPQKGVTYRLLAYYGEGEYDFIESKPFTEMYEDIKFNAEPHSGYLHPNFIQGINLSFVPVKAESYRNGDLMYSVTEFDNAYDDGNYMFAWGDDKTGIYEFRAYFTDDQYLSAFFAVGEQQLYTLQPKDTKMKYEQIGYTSYIQHYAEINFNFEMDKDDRYDIEKKIDSNTYVSYNTNNSDPGTQHSCKITEEGTYRIVVRKPVSDGNRTLYIPYDSRDFTVSKDKRFVQEPYRTVCHSRAGIPGRVYWETAFYPNKIVIQKLKDGEYVDLYTYSSESLLFYLTFEVGHPSYAFRIFHEDLGPGTYRIRAWYGKEEWDYITSDSFQVEEFQFKEQPHDKYYSEKLVADYGSSLSLRWKTNGYTYQNRAVLYRRPAGSDESVPWDEFDISSPTSEYDDPPVALNNDGYYNLRSTDKYESYEYFLRIWLTDNEESYTDSEVFTVDMQGTFKGFLLFAEPHNFATANEEISVPVALTDNPGFKSGEFLVRWDYDEYDLIRIEYNEDVLPVHDLAPIRTHWGYYIIPFGDPQANQNFQDTGLAFTLYFKRHVDNYPGDDADDEVLLEYYLNDEKEYYDGLTEEEYFEGCNEEYRNYYYDYSSYEYGYCGRQCQVSIDLLTIDSCDGGEVKVWGTASPALVFGEREELAIGFDHVYTYTDNGEMQIPVYAISNPGFQTCTLSFETGYPGTFRVEPNREFAPLIHLETVTNEYGDTNIQVVLGDENATENFTGTGLMFNIIVGLVTEMVDYDPNDDYIPAYNGDIDLWRTGDDYAYNVEDEYVEVARYNECHNYASNFSFEEQPHPCEAESFDDVFENECRIEWKPTQKPMKQVIYCRPAGADDSTPWESIEISGYSYKDGTYAFTIPGTRGDSTFEYFIRAWDDQEKRFEDDEINVIYQGGEGYIDSEIFTIHINGRLTLKSVPAKEPTYEEEGNISYYMGSDARYYISEDEEYVEVNREDVILPKKEYTPVEIHSIDVNGKIATSTVYVEKFEEEGYELPAAPYLDGRIFVGWKVNATLYTTSEEAQMAVNELVAEAPEEAITIEVEYEQQTEEHLVLVEGGTLPDGSTEGSFQAATELSVMADPAEEGFQFDHWELNGETVSYNEECPFFVSSKEDMTFTAVYSSIETEVERVGTAVIESVTVMDEEGKIAFVSYVSIPSDARILKAGIVSATEEYLEGEDLDIWSARFVRYNDTTCYDYLAFRYTWTKKNVSADEVWCVRAYLVYSDANGEKHTVYGDVVKANLEGVITETE